MPALASRTYRPSAAVTVRSGAPGVMAGSRTARAPRPWSRAGRCATTSEVSSQSSSRFPSVVTVARVIVRPASSPAELCQRRVYCSRSSWRCHRPFTARSASMESRCSRRSATRPRNDHACRHPTSTTKRPTSRPTSRGPISHLVRPQRRSVPRRHWRGAAVARQPRTPVDLRLRPGRARDAPSDERWQRGGPAAGPAT